jgi:uncharacterized protein (TIGR03118 family)
MISCRWRGLSGRRTAAVLVAGSTIAVASVLPPVAAGAATERGFREVNLISDKPGLARLTDPLVKNPWGIALGPDTPLWVANNGTATATIYAGANGSDPISKVPLDVQLPSAPTGQVFNPTHHFVVRGGGAREPARFLFDTISSRIAGWSPEVPPLTKARTVATVSNHVYLGLAVARTAKGPRFYAADGAGTIDVFDGQFRLLPTPRAFHDPSLPGGLAPYNVAVLEGRVFVAYAPVPGVTASVDGVIDVFDHEGRFLRRLVTGGPLDEPWGMVLAPAGWGRFGGALLVGNEEDGRINAFDPRTGEFRGTLRDANGKAIAHEGLWGLAFGNGVVGTPRTLIFAAGIDDYEHGLIGLIRPN